MSYSSVGALGPASFTTTSTLCKPVGAEASRAAEELQRQLNRVASAAKFAPVKVDGLIGKDTVALANRCLATTGIWLAVVTCTQLVGEIAYWTDVFKKAADRNGVPTTLPAPAPGGAPAPGPAGVQPLAPRIGGGGPLAWLGRRSLIEKVGLGVGGMVAVLVVASAVRGVKARRGRR